MNSINFRENIFLYSTNWYVITGAPCSGKTAVIKYLEKQGFSVVHETARNYINNELRKGKTIQQIRSDELAFQRYIMTKKFKIENLMPVENMVFFDRGMPDSIAYYRFAGFNPAVAIEKSRFFKYKKVYMFERLLIENDPVRWESDKDAEKLHQLIIEAYHLLGYQLIYVPVLPIKERADFIIKEIETS